MSVDDSGVTLAFRVQCEEVLVVREDNPSFANGKLEMLLIGCSGQSDVLRQRDVDPQAPQSQRDRLMDILIQVKANRLRHWLAVPFLEWTADPPAASRQTHALP